jgi:prefoldin subunit 5
MLSTLKDLSKKIKYVEKNKDKVQNNLKKMKKNIGNLSFLYKDDEKYNGVVNNKAVQKLLGDLAQSIDNTSN